MSHGWIKRYTWLKRAATRIKNRGRPRFKEGRDPLWVTFIRGLPCILANSPHTECQGPSECCHVKARSTGGEDRSNTVPMCRKHHRRQHDMGIRTFQRVYGIDLEAIARELSDKETW
jgi:hypothetical protein